MPISDEGLAQARSYSVHLLRVWQEGTKRYGDGVPTFHPNTNAPKFPRFGFLPFPAVGAMLAKSDDGRDLFLPFAIVSAGRIFLVGMLDYRGWPNPPSLSTIQGSHLYAIDASGVIPYPFERSNL